ncbi:MAG: cob(I)yrinic acid a,c-diamide adenosyltransferase [Hyphomicrobiales bacterium]|nr:cob(I)yrinic acid a,c-diamide adenosyltransferase [Hyphomicrobiales bacterium]
MVKLNKIYTRTGDDGATGLVDGSRRRKDDPRVEAYGVVDETNSFIGLARLSTKDDAALDAMLARIQNDLFDLGADLATPPGPRMEGALRVHPHQVERLEREIDAMNADIAPLKSFVLPGGSAAAAALHVARATCRRAERIMAHLAALEPVEPAALHYINRLSDHLFVAARRANGNGAGDVLWVPGQNR